MAKNRILMAAVAAAALAASAGAASAASMAVTTATTNLRAGPSVGQPVLDVLPAGVPVRVIACTDWCKVDHRGQLGWVTSARLVDSPGWGGGQTWGVIQSPGVAYVGTPYGYYSEPSGIQFRVYVGRDGRHWYDDHRGGRHYVDRQKVRFERRDDRMDRRENRLDARDQRLDDRRDRLNDRSDRIKDRNDR